MLKVKASSIIRPAKPTPRHRLWLSDLDLIQPITHAPTVYFYRPTPTTTTDNFFSPQIMKNSLSQVLVHFYPLAGQLSHDHETSRPELDCNENGAVFYEAECDAEIDDFGDFKPTPGLRALAPSVNYGSQPDDSPLLLVQLTVFRCGGVSIGVAVKHTVMDGTSAAHFLSTWAKIARTGELDVDVKPFFDRTVLRAPDHPPTGPGPTFDHEEFKASPPLLGEEDGEEKKETAVEMFKLTSQQVKSIKQATNAGGDGAEVSRFKSVVVHLWRCTCMARGLDGDQPTKLYFSLDGRRRLRPPLPEGFFGNVVFNVSVTARSGDLVFREVGHTAGLIEEATVRMTRDEYLRSTLQFLNGQQDLAPFRRGAHTLGCTQTQANKYGLPNLTVTSWLGIPFYDADFGWGPPVHMGPAALGFEGKVFIIPSAEDDGSLILALRLHTQHMDRLRELLYRGLSI